jgi:hypothetical protein
MIGGVMVRAAINDFNGRPVELTEERWSHIVERHPEIQPLDQSLLQAIEVPNHHLPGHLANEEWFYLKTDRPSNWLRSS